VNVSERHQKAKSVLISPSEAISKSQVRTTSRSEAFPKGEALPKGKARSHMSDTKTPRKCEAFSKDLS